MLNNEEQVRLASCLDMIRNEIAGKSEYGLTLGTIEWLAVKLQETDYELRSKPKSTVTLLINDYPEVIASWEIEKYNCAFCGDKYRTLSATAAHVKKHHLDKTGLRVSK